MSRLCAGALLACTGTDAVFLKRSTEHDLRAYSFDDFARDYSRSYEVGSQEYRHRAAIFSRSMEQVIAKNSRVGRSYTAGVNHFMDWTHAERRSLNGYKPSQMRVPTLSAIQLNSSYAGKQEFAESYEAQGPPVRSQGDCGSCWAISAVEALESRLIQAGTPARLSPQALVDCAPNPHHCGGTGGCDGATAELGYAFVRDHGIPMESDLPYTHQTGKCSMNAGGADPYPSSKRVRVSGWSSLPSNQQEPLMQALVNDGPAVVAVDANNWFDYEGGIFDDCQKDAVLVHAVLAKGYGQADGKKYWSIQNSWGSEWGENGDIRVLRHDDETQWCGTDREPEKGLGCEGGPKEITVCGTCGILYDPVIPQGVRLEDGDGSGTSESLMDGYIHDTGVSQQPQQTQQPQQPQQPQQLQAQPSPATTAQSDLPAADESSSQKDAAPVAAHVSDSSDSEATKKMGSFWQSFAGDFIQVSGRGQGRR